MLLCRCSRGGADKVVQTRWCRSGGAEVQRCRDAEMLRVAESQKCRCSRGYEDVLVGRCRGSAEEVFVRVIVQV